MTSAFDAIFKKMTAFPGLRLLEETQLHQPPPLNDEAIKWLADRRARLRALRLNEKSIPKLPKRTKSEMTKECLMILFMQNDTVPARLAEAFLAKMRAKYGISISPAALDRVKKNLGIVSVRHGKEWMWRLEKRLEKPETIPESSPTAQTRWLCEIGQLIKK